MMIVFANSKGGVGKSTLSVHLAVWLFDRGAKVALLDADAQMSSYDWIREAEPKITVVNAVTPEEVASAAQNLRQSHDFVVADAPGRLEDESRTLLILADLAVFPIMPSILDFRSLQEAAATLKYARTINGGKPEARLVLNGVDERTSISRELQSAAPALGLCVAKATVRRLIAFPEAAQQGTVATRMGRRGSKAAGDVSQVFAEIMCHHVARSDGKNRKATTKRAANE